MKIIDDLQPKTKTFLFGGFMIFLASGIPWWVIDYETYSLSHINSYVSIGSCLFGALIMGLFSDLRFIEKIGTALVAHMAAFFVKLVIDTQEDPTNHNLFPFEMAYYLFFDGIGAVILVSIGSLVRKWIR
jgi:hypothetical protein